jgi:bifunctional DNA-binding transcriptional regulator/antitoxin component of YhaV-PrlF toxin-antitoxin module
VERKYATEPLVIRSAFFHTSRVANVVGERFQITIDRKVRAELGVKPGDLAVERVEEGRLVVTFMPAPHDRSLLGVLRAAAVDPVTDWQKVKDDAWRMRTAEVVDAMRRDQTAKPDTGR